MGFVLYHYEKLIWNSGLSFVFLNSTFYSRIIVLACTPIEKKSNFNFLANGDLVDSMSNFGLYGPITGSTLSGQNSVQKRQNGPSNIDGPRNGPTAKGEDMLLKILISFYC